MIEHTVKLSVALSTVELQYTVVLLYRESTSLAARSTKS